MYVYLCIYESFEMQAQIDLWEYSLEQEMLTNWTEWSDVVLANIRSEFQRGIHREREKMEERLLC